MRKIIPMLILPFLLPLQTQALQMNYTVGARVGVGLGTSSTTKFFPVVPTDLYPILQGLLTNTVRVQGASYNHVATSLGIYGDIGFNHWFALTPEFFVSFGNRTRVVDHTASMITLAPGIEIPELSLLGLWDQHLRFTDFQFDLLAKFRYGWMYIAIGPGFSIATAPKFVDDKSLNDVYSRKMKVDFISAFDIGLNVPLDKNKQHFVTFNARANFNISGMIGLFQDSKAWDEGNFDQIDPHIRGVNSVRGTFYLGYMYRFT
ncbi:hypothetical protein [Entomospira culicis]|uniref:Outer membrane protein beta-barrel domain-containing protein n=1 Tax=Entomospira culicis TaxID=2719989 RepID=A0A968GH85_9SPIO|nr:hypothetical protein [Entomospira culicis]NIZ18772.1 hypothetical protein [Entomospira culicis]NIZ68987.1 hypothetical protein [Entomospira culicis]WDI37578.1 hypothetical protein PVA46_01975 [Entomospira culicis]WDI39206.1 hypothetical protein PVA47_01980 [Entomospira culicis]